MRTTSHLVLINRRSSLLGGKPLVGPLSANSMVRESSHALLRDAGVDRELTSIVVVAKKKSRR